MKKLLLLLLTMLTSAVSAYAQTFTDQATGITYNVIRWPWEESPGVVSPGEVEVTKKASGSYKGEITIPSQVNDDEGKTYNVTRITSNAFQDCTGLTSITIPSSVESIGWRAFSGCTKLTSITIPESVTSIDGSTFSECTKLTSVIIPNSVTYLGGSAFSGCSKLTDVTLSNKLTAIPDGTFSNCTSLTSYIIPNGMTRIDGSAFSGCTNLTSITIPNSVETIGGSAFSGCSKLTSIDISHTTQATIESYTFYNCSSLASITIPNTVEKIGDEAFYGCKALTSIAIPNDVTEIGRSAFSNCTGLTSFTIPNGVTEINSGTFSGCSGLTSITIPSSVETIGGSAFYGCSKLASIDISSITQTTIEWGTFENCSSLTSITIPAGIDEIGSSAFSGCTGLTSITIPASVETIRSNAFSSCTGLTSITIPKNVTTIESYAFNSCDNIKVVTSEITDPFEVDGSVFGWSWNYNAALIVPKDKIAAYKETSGWNQFAVTLEEGSSYAIEKTEDGIDFKLRQADDYSVYYVVTGISDVSKKEIVIPATLDGCPVKAIAIDGDKYFRNCKNLTKVTIPGSVEINNGNPLYGCIKLTDVNIVVLDYAEFCNNQILKYLDNNNIWDDNGNQKEFTLHLIDKDGKEITDYVIPEGVTTIGDYAFRGCTGLASITIPSGVTTIGNEAFNKCKALTEITFPSSLTTIGNNAFYNCTGLTSITIPENVTSIGSYAFGECNGIKVVTSKLQEPFAVDAFNWWYYNAILYVPEGLVAAYKEKSGWNGFGYIIEEGGTIVEKETTVDGIKYSLRQTEDDKVYYAVTEISDVNKTEIVIPAEINDCPVKVIEGWNFFQNCKSLTKITIPGSVEINGGNPFYGCIKLDDVNIVVSDYAEFCNNKILGSLENPVYYYDDDTHESINKYFTLHLLDKDGNDITDYVIPEGVTTIGNAAFKGYTALSSITIPNSVTEIGDGAFYGCTGLKTVTSEISSPFNVKAFELIAGPADPLGLNTATLFVPKGSRAAYKEKSGWDFALIYEKGETIYDNQQTDKQGVIYTLRQDAKDYSFYYAVTGHTDALKMEIVIPADINGLPVKAIEAADRWTSENGEGAFIGCSDLTSVKIGKNVRSIGDYAFYNCTSLNTVTLPKRLESIGNYAFSGSNIWNWSSGSNKYISVNSITSITIPSRVETIGDGAFQGCSELISITFETVEEDEEGGLTSIGNEAFWRCAFATITLPNSVSTIGRAAFAYNEKLSTVTLGDAITEIKEETFFSCNALTYVAIPDGVTSIGREAFKSCWSLTSLKLPNSLTTIGEQAFDGCQMKSIELPDSYTAIPANMFQSNDFEYIKLGNNIKSIGKNAFGSKLEGDETNVVIEISTATPPSISKDAFPSLPALSVVNVIVPNATIEGVYKETAVWSDMTYANLETNIEVTVEKVAGKEQDGSIGTDVLDQCGVAAARVVGLKVKGTINAKDFTQLRSNFKSLLRLDLSECDITEIPDGAMTGKTQLQELTLPTKVQTIGNNAFQGCPYLTGKLDLPTGVTSIGNYAFEGTYYTSITLPRSLKTIGDYAFYKLPLMQKVIIPDGMTSIGAYAFAETAIYGNITIPDGVTKLGDGAFRNTQISSVFLPTGISSLNWSVFQGCNILDVVYVPDNVTSMSGYAFDGCSTLTNLRLSANLTSMGEYALQNTNVEYIKVPSKVKTLAQGVLKNVKNLESLVLPTYLKAVGAEALYGCSGLRNLSVDAIEPPTAERTSFIGVNTDLCLISIPTESYIAYRNAEYWGLFVQMRNDIAVETEGDGQIAFEAVEEGEEEESLARARTRRFAAVRALRARTRGSEQVDEPELTYAKNGSSVLVPENGQVNFLIIGEVETATLDGVDITDDIIDGVYTATADKKNAKLVVKFTGESQEEEETEYIKIGSAKQVPFCSSFDLDFTDKPELKAYVATGYDKSSGVIWLTRVKQVPAETGFLLMGEAGDYNIPISMSAADVYYKNMFKGTIEGTTIYENEWSDRTYRTYTNYYLSNGKAGVGFYKVTKPEGQSIGANRCYLPIPTDIWSNGWEGGTEVIKVGAAKQVPYYTNSWTALDFTSLDAQGVKAYTATGYNYKTGTIWLSRVKKVPGNTGVLIMAQEAGEYEVPTAQVELYYENMFKGSESAQTIYTNETIDGVDYVNYYLSNGASGVGFYKVTKAEGVNMGANRCYLPIPKRDSASGARGMRDEASFSEMIFSDNDDDVIAIPVFGSIDGADGETTGINSQPQDAEPDAYYNLQGQRVENPGKGIYIKNGKKVVIK